MPERTGAPFKIHKHQGLVPTWVVEEWMPQEVHHLIVSTRITTSGYEIIGHALTWAEALDIVITEWDLEGWDDRLQAESNFYNEDIERLPSTGVSVSVVSAPVEDDPDVPL